MNNYHQNDNNDTKLLMKRILIACLVFFVILTAMQLLKVNRNVPLGKVEETVTDTIYVRTNDAVMSVVLINYQVVVDTEKMDSYSLRQFNQNRWQYYRRILHSPVAEALRNEAMGMNFSQENILENYQTMVNRTITNNFMTQTIVDNVKAIDWKSFDFVIVHESSVLEYLESKAKAKTDVKEAEENVTKAKAALEN
jgi:hypothetical protein